MFVNCKCLETNWSINNSKIEIIPCTFLCNHCIVELHVWVFFCTMIGYNLCDRLIMTVHCACSTFLRKTIYFLSDKTIQTHTFFSLNRVLWLLWKPQTTSWRRFKVSLMVSCSLTSSGSWNRIWPEKNQGKTFEHNTHHRQWFAVISATIFVRLEKETGQFRIRHAPLANKFQFRRIIIEINKKTC